MVIATQLTGGNLVGTEQQHTCLLPCEHAAVYLHLDTTLLPGEVQTRSPYPGCLHKVFPLWLKPHKHHHSFSQKPDFHRDLAVDFKYIQCQEVSSRILSFGEEKSGQSEHGETGWKIKVVRIFQFRKDCRLLKLSKAT